MAHIPFASALLLAATSLSACDHCEQYACDLQTVDRQSAEPGSVVTWNGASMALGSGNVSEGDPPPPTGTCYAMFGQSGNSTSEASGDVPNTWLSVTLNCTWFNGPYQVSFGAVVGDLAEPNADPMPVQAQGWYDHDASERVDAYFTFEAMLTVEESAGTKAALPDMVTPDFKRVVRFDLAAGQAVSGAPDLGATLQFTLTAQNFHYQPDAECEVCRE